eukprot:Filipodium_phascolosomae@DN1408_c0_g1_i1.p1
MCGADTEGGYGALSKWPKRFIVAMGPHGVVPVTAWAVGSDPSAILYGPTAVANVLLRMPLIHGIVCGLYKVIPSTRKSIMKVLSSGQNVMLYPGGIAEIFVNSPTKEKLYWRNRKGIVRVAMEGGADILPLYFLGQTCMFTWIDTGKVGEAISRFLGVSLGAFYGKWGLPIPKQVKVHCLVGSPFELPHAAKPSQELVDEYHQKLLQHVQDLYDRHHSINVNYIHKSLEIV